MAKQSGVGSRLWVGSVDLSGDIGAINSAETMRGTLPSTSIADAAEARILGLRDGSLSFNAYWNTRDGQAHATLSALPRTDVQCILAAGTPAVGSAGAAIIAKQLGYAPARGQDGSLLATVTAQANGYGLEWGQFLTASAQTFASGSVNGTSVDGGASTSFGAAAYLNVLSLDSGTPTVTIQDSSDNSSFTAVTGMAFSPTGASVARVQGAVNATVNRYVRVRVTGTYSGLVAVLLFVRYTEDPS